MATVNAQVHGRAIVKDITANTVQDVFNSLDYTGEVTAMVNGEPSSMSTTLNDYDFVTFSKAVDGGNK